MIIDSVAKYIGFAYFGVPFTAKAYKEIHHFLTVTGDVCRYVPCFMVSTNHSIALNEIIYAEFALWILTFESTICLFLEYTCLSKVSVVLPLFDSEM